MPRKYTPEERIAAFWAKVQKDPTPDGCWPRPYGLDPSGYARFWDGQRQNTAHRFAFELAYGPAPDGLFVLHTCDNPTCVRNDDEGWYEVNGVLCPRRGHLFLGTPQENTADMVSKGREGFTYTARPELIPRGDEHYTRKHPELVRQGEQWTHAKLTDEQVRTIRERYAAGERGYKLAAEFGVSKAQVSRIVNRVDRRHA